MFPQSKQASVGNFKKETHQSSSQVGSALFPNLLFDLQQEFTFLQYLATIIVYSL